MTDTPGERHEQASRAGRRFDRTPATRLPEGLAALGGRGGFRAPARVWQRAQQNDSGMILEKKYPSVAYLERTAARRLPGFVKDYLFGAIGGNLNLERNRRALDAVRFMPRYLSAAPRPNIERTLFGRRYDAPFGVAPVGLSGLIWPRAEYLLAEAARRNGIPYTLSTVACASLEAIREVAGENGWFQYYPVNAPEVEASLLERCEQAGYDTILLTVDVPVHTRRAHDIRNGLSVPPRFDLRTLAQIVAHPRWALQMLAAGVPQFRNVIPYYGPGPAMSASAKFLGEVMKGHITPARFRQIRDRWRGRLVVKGVLDVDEARQYLDMGADGLLVSNHGGRQADAAPSSAEMLPRIRRAVGADAVLLVDSGVRTGLDIARMLALGADFVLLGRAFMFAVAAAGQAGAEHLSEMLKAELRADLGQLGCPDVAELPRFLYDGGADGPG